MRPPAKELVAVVGGLLRRRLAGWSRQESIGPYCIALGAFQGIKSLPVVLKLSAKGFEAVASLLLLGSVEFILRLVQVLVDRPREGGQSGRDLAFGQKSVAVDVIESRAAANLGAQPRMGLEWKRKHQDRRAIE